MELFVYLICGLIFSCLTTALLSYKRDKIEDVEKQMDDVSIIVFSIVVFVLWPIAVFVVLLSAILLIVMMFMKRLITEEDNKDSSLTEDKG